MQKNDKAENPDNAYPTRKPTRLPHYDYSQNGCYFVTICTASKKPLFGRYLVGALHEAPAVNMPCNRFIALNRRGVITKEILYSLPKRFLQIQIENAIIMPNHIHLLLTIDWENGKWERALREAPLQRSLLAQAIGYFKANTSKELHKTEPNLQVWQRGFYEHIIRNETEFRRAWEYIEYNALKEYGKSNTTEEA